MEKKIGLFIPALTGGGAQRVAVNLARGFVKHGCEVEILLVYGGGVLEESVHPDVDVVNFNVKRTIHSIPLLAWRIYQSDFDAVISFMGYANVCALLSHLISPKKSISIVTEHTNVSAQTGEQGGRGYAIHYLSKILYPIANAVVTVSEGVAKDVREEVDIIDNKVSVIYNPVVTDGLHRLASLNVDHPWFENDEPVILGVGRLIRDKNFKLLLRSFQQVNKETPARLVILGEGPERHTLEQEAKRMGIQDRVAMPGFKANPYSYMSASDVVVLSSTREGFGNVLVEAMACGTPVVSTDCPSGPSEILEEGKWGALVPVGNTEELSNAIQSTLKNPPSPKSLKIRSEEFGAEKIATDYLNLIGELK